MTRFANETLCVHGGAARDHGARGAINTPLVLSSTFVQDGPGGHQGYHYGRVGNPSRAALEATLAGLEGAPHALAFASGCAAATTALLTLGAGAHVLAGRDLYGGTHRLLRQVMEPFAVATSFVDLARVDDVLAALRPTTRMIWAESPSNPLLKVVDLAALATIARERRLTLVVDNTLATPILQRPLELGATLVLHSTTKYINGHCDVLGGALMTRDDALADHLRALQRAVGAVPSPFDCYLIERGLKTLALRVARQVDAAHELARWLTTRPEVARVHYPGLPEHPTHALAAQQMRGPGAMISLELKGGGAAARALLKATRLFSCAISLGGVESLAEHPASMTHAMVPEPERLAAGITEGLVRLSVGIEALDDLRADLERGLTAEVHR
ncbi:MAG: PLP-dependent transferase [Kofleriaceae bacterium]